MKFRKSTVIFSVPFSKLRFSLRYYFHYYYYYYYHFIITIINITIIIIITTNNSKLCALFQTQVLTPRVGYVHAAMQSYSRTVMPAYIHSHIHILIH